MLSPNEIIINNQQIVRGTDHNEKFENDIARPKDTICNNEVYNCDECERSYKLKSSLKRHKKKAHCPEKGLYL